MKHFRIEHNNPYSLDATKTEVSLTGANVEKSLQMMTKLFAKTVYDSPKYRRKAQQVDFETWYQAQVQERKFRAEEIQATEKVISYAGLLTTGGQN
jgi:hypothetical protein